MVRPQSLPLLGTRCNKSMARILRFSIFTFVLSNIISIWNDDTSIAITSVSNLDAHHDTFATMALPNRMGFSFDTKGNNTNQDTCDDILLFMPYAYSINGQGAQLNSFIHASLLATYLNKPLVVIEAPEFHIIPDWAHHMPENSLYDSGSQFGCPAEYFHAEGREFPSGLSRLIQIPEFVSRGCGVPTCSGKFSYHNWEAIRRVEKQYFIKNRQSNVIQCTEGSKIVHVTVAGGAQIRRLFVSYSRKMLDRSSKSSRKAAFDWAIRLGASVDEANTFSGLKSTTAIWDYLSALINRSGLVKFQPWIARDVGEYIRSSNFPLNLPYDGIHIRRGDKLLEEAKGEVNKYWRSKGYSDETTWPTNYIPFSHYVEVGWSKPKCKTRGQSRKQNDQQTYPRTVYVATDDPTTVISEIQALPKSRDGYTLLNHCGDKADFVFSPSSRTTLTFHINDRRDGDDCHKVYARNIAAIADMIILTRADKLVADFNSNWGRFIRNFRLFIDDNSHHVFLNDMVSAFGHAHPGSPGS